ncbi:MAG: DNA starvation/stationary phase protection protein [Lewinellaceae bacterium]|nr:DNA starvation/stationary phase protection protein [Lewinellaceae bacterium]
MDYLGINKNQSVNTVKELNQLLANYQVYYQNLRNFHWNVSGEHFFDLHAQFEGLYTDARAKIDAIAERILTLRYRPMSNLASYLREAQIEEAGKVSDDREMVRIILENHRELIERMRSTLIVAEEVKDEGTIDMIAGYLSDLEKRSWMLDAWYAQKSERIMA